MRRLQEQVYQANLELKEYGLVTATFGNVSGIDRASGIVAIKPSGLPYDQLSPEKMVLVDLQYNVLEGELKPSSDTKTHVMLYRSFEQIGGIVHTHSTYATAWAQALKPLPCYGTTHADIFHGQVPCTAVMREDQIERDYEEETAVQILETFQLYDYQQIPGVLVASHGPFTWGQTPEKAVYHSLMLETIAEMAILSLNITPGLKAIKKSLMDKHFLRKHGRNAYYGQPGKENR
ncbi:MAG: L-ribulose-5-phosphate 4-epimerase AraD [Spirochaetaceae bacterium]|nr:MAG: L-ribulose-5-phosphate 4-epimerase AraD [Spirochaetaceae bacterium]